MSTSHAEGMKHMMCSEDTDHWIILELGEISQLTSIVQEFPRCGPVKC